MRDRFLLFSHHPAYVAWCAATTGFGASGAYACNANNKDME